MLVKETKEIVIEVKQCYVNDKVVRVGATDDFLAKYKMPKLTQALETLNIPFNRLKSVRS